MVLEQRGPPEARLLAPLWARQQVINRLIKRFELSNMYAGSDVMMLPRTIQAVTQVDELLQDHDANVETKSLIAAAGTYVPYETTPLGKRRRFYGIYTGGSTGAGRLQIQRGAVVVQMEVANTAERFRDLLGLVIDENDSIGLTTTGNGADGAISMVSIYSEEDSFRS